MGLDREALKAGVKCALAGVIAFSVSTALELAMPHWAVLTVMILMTAEYVGTIWEKAALRFAGTLIGAAIGVLTAGCWSVAPWAVYLITAVTLLVGALGWKGHWYPYAFLLMGITQLLMVAGASSFHLPPWQAGLDRVIEIVIGVAVSILVTRFIWPRYARDDFHDLCSTTMRDIGHYLTGKLQGKADPEKQAAFSRDFAANMVRLGQLLKSGKRESRRFAACVPGFRSLLRELQLLYESARSLGRQPLLETAFAPHLQPDLDSSIAAVRRLFDDLSQSKISPHSGWVEQCQETLQQLEKRVGQVRKSGLTRNIPIAEALDYSASYVGLHEIANRLCRIAQLKELLLRDPHQLTKRKEPHRWLPSTAWQPALRSTFIGVSALWLSQTFSLPGGPLIPLVAVVMSLLTIGSVDQTGDALVWRRYAEWLLGAGLLILTGPTILSALAFPPLFWTFLIAGLVLFGAVADQAGGLTVRLVLMLFLFPGTLLLGWRQTVDSEMISSMVTGLLLGLLYATLCQRLIFPDLPGRHIVAGWRQMVETCRLLLRPAEPATREDIVAELVLQPMAVRGWIGALQRLRPRDERIIHYESALKNLESAGYYLSAAIFPNLTGIDPAKSSEAVRWLVSVRTAFDEELAGLMSEPTLQRATPVNWQLLKDFTERVETWRFELFDQRTDSFDHWIPLITAVGRLQLARQRLTTARLEWLAATGPAKHQAILADSKPHTISRTR